MKVDSIKIFIGSSDCNASCPYCISKMLKTKEALLNKNKIKKACWYAQLSECKKAIITGIGEPTLHPDKIYDALSIVKNYYPIISLQTNGYLLSKEEYDDNLYKWYDDGLTTIALSALDFNSKKNSEIMHLPYFSLDNLIEKLHNIGYSVRLAYTLYKRENKDFINDAINYAKKMHVEQLTFRRLAIPFYPKDNKITAWSKEHELSEKQYKKIEKRIAKHATKLLEVAGGWVYDVNGQNVAIILRNFIPPDEELKQMVVFPSGRTLFDKRYLDSILL